MNSQLLSELEKIVGPGGILASDDDLMVYECDAFVAAKRRPQVVVFPTSAEQVSAIVKVANRHEIPVVPRGAGTGLSGGSMAETGAVMVALTRMNQILEV